MTSEIKNTIEATFWKLDLIKQAVRGIAHRGATGCFVASDVEGEVLPVEDVLDDVKAELEKAIEAMNAEEAAA
jgi:hypothetical protein